MNNNTKARKQSMSHQERVESAKLGYPAKHKRPKVVGRNGGQGMTMAEQRRILGI